ncbi:uncharacterized protein GIQ15_04968 [Arthroderma uncinatum]|uniref:uncharacterized protein n=1 Tax=Arthroderma uncinatum TaxID=74035 RepID=UPI00144A512F|nr:uncharacterized protein GIQ15_04968 [Arthroderma uncinatum]KAF3482209.1 hypothetical protein GIQ15_04968 [Arthroderma uncinatum]
MFHVGNSHKCDSCGKSNELHGKRHKDILTLIEQIHALDRGEQSRGSKFSNHTTIFDRAPLTPGRNVVRAARGIALLTLGDSPSSLRRTLSAKDRRAEKKAVKLEKDMTKNMKRQANRLTVPGVVLASSVELVNKAIHGTNHLESSISPQEADAFFVASIRRFQELEHQIQELAAKREATKHVELKDGKVSSPAREKGDYRGVNKLELPMIREILAQLAIRVRLNENGYDKDRKVLLMKVADAVCSDIMLVANEARETMRRSAGYWRFVNKRTYNAMVRNSKIVNWETGEKLPECRSIDSAPDTQS